MLRLVARSQHLIVRAWEGVPTSLQQQQSLLRRRQRSICLEGSFVDEGKRQVRQMDCLFPEA